ncbi:MAG: peptide chain release factor N(5)-glutamine methyltransferase [Odoribacteraceae bacterium]|jgi:release factor glutamine methyltransferase|nr:peptide chain release factor N(5)-glutamine methyltransferase [Odoribacteraceae bacterium]
MNTISRLYSRALIELKNSYGEEEIRFLCTVIFREVFRYTKVDIHLRKHDPLEEGGVNKFLEIIAGLKEGRPFQYVMGETEFAGKRFRVNEETLIPRPETEELVEWIRASGGVKEGERLLDIGTGSGCIAIVLAGWFPGGKVQGVDISAEALRVASENARLNGVRVDLLERDILHHDAWEWPVYNVIVSNPPYVRLSERAMMHERVVAHEPHRALFVPDQDPLLFYRVIAGFGQHHLAAGGRLFFEINEAMGAEATRLLEGMGYGEIEVRQDLFGKERMIRCVWK